MNYSTTSASLRTPARADSIKSTSSTTSSSSSLKMSGSPVSAWSTPTKPATRRVISGGSSNNSKITRRSSLASCSSSSALSTTSTATTAALSTYSTYSSLSPSASPFPSFCYTTPGGGGSSNTSTLPSPLSSPRATPTPTSSSSSIGRRPSFSSVAATPASRHKPRQSLYSSPSRTAAAAAASPVASFSPSPDVAAFGTPSARKPVTVDPKYKTELCSNFAVSGTCTFGSRCSFAHGPAELRTIRVKDLAAAGIPNADTHRVRPCLTFVSTGSCPFGVRCNSLHDPRVELSIPTLDEPSNTPTRSGDNDQGREVKKDAVYNETWLGHFEQPLRGVDSDLVVAHLHHHFVNGVTHGNSFGKILATAVESMATKENSTTCNTNFLSRQKIWEKFYNSIATGQDLSLFSVKNDERGIAPPGLSFAAAEAAAAAANTRAGINVAAPPNKLSERQRLEIVLEMAYTPKATWYQYQPSHTVLGRTVMIVQTRTFALNTDGSVDSIRSDEAVEHERPTVTVYEMAQGSDASPKARDGAALFFGIPIEAIEPYTPRKSRSPSPMAGSSRPDPTLSNMDVYQPFYLTRPLDESAMALTVGILRHKLQELELAELQNKKVDNHSKSTSALIKRKQVAALDAIRLGLRSRFDDLIQHWASLYWDRCSDRADPTNANATVLHVNGKYNLQDYPQGTGAARSVSLWNSFIGEMSRGNGDIKSDNSREYSSCSRLDVFADMAEGMHIVTNDPTPLIAKKGIVDQNESTTPHAAAQTRCWRDLLLTNEAEGEWETIRKIIKAKERKRCSSSSRPSTPSTPLGGNRGAGTVTFTPIRRSSMALESPCATPVSLPAVPEIMF